MRILCYSQTLIGVGHFVRMHLLAQGFAAAGHDVGLVDGAGAVPRPLTGPQPVRLSIPAVVRRPDGALAGVDDGSVSQILAERARSLVDAVGAMRPDVVLVDQWPFNKWDLGDEITGMIGAARRANPALRVWCCRRDIANQTRLEPVPRDEYPVRVGDLLEEWFDGLLVHADPALVRIDDDFAAAARIAPVTYTGYVAERAPSGAPRPAPPPYAIVSTGGLHGAPFLAAAVAAIERACPGLAVHAFAPPGAPGIGVPGATVHPFSTDFARWLTGAALSISRAGYNTSAAILAARVRAVVVPDPRLPDQLVRASVLHEAGLATACEEDVDAIAKAVIDALAGPPPSHTLDLDGATTTRRIVESGGPDRT
jgi:predicted glycosyltransferase